MSGEESVACQLCKAIEADLEDVKICNLCLAVICDDCWRECGACHSSICRKCYNYCNLCVDITCHSCMEILTDRYYNCPFCNEKVCKLCLADKTDYWPVCDKCQIHVCENCFDPHSTRHFVFVMNYFTLELGCGEMLQTLTPHIKTLRKLKKPTEGGWSNCWMPLEPE